MSRHLTWAISKLFALLKVMENMTKSVTSEVISRTEEDIDFFRKTTQENRGDMVEKILNQRFERYHQNNI